MIVIKPHHFIDIVTAVGEGRTTFVPHALGHALHTVADGILADLDGDLRIELGADDICAPCRQNLAGVCQDTIDTSYRPLAPASKREYNLRIDRRWCDRLGLRQGEKLTVRGFLVRLRERAGELHGIYLEMPAERTAARQARLRKGIERLLPAAPQP